MQILQNIYQSEITNLEKTIDYINPLNACDDLVHIAFSSVDKKLMAIADNIVRYADEKFSDGQTHEVTLPSGVTIDLRKEADYIKQCKAHVLSHYAYFNMRYFAGMVEIYLGYLRGEDVKADESDIDWLSFEFETLGGVCFDMNDTAGSSVCMDVLTLLYYHNDANVDVDLREALHAFRDVAEKHNIEKVWQYHISPLY